MCKSCWKYAICIGLCSWSAKDPGNVCWNRTRQKLYLLKSVPDHYKTQDMCSKSMYITPAAFFLVPEYFKTQEMSIGAAVADPWQLHNVPNNFKTQVMCDDVVCEHPCNLQYNPDSFVTRGLVKISHDEDDYYNDDEFVEWYNGY